MNQIVCARRAASIDEAALFAQVLSANDVHCILQRMQSDSLPDLGSNGLRQIMVHQEDLSKAERLLSEIETAPQALPEYQEKESLKMRVIHWLSDHLHRNHGS